MDAVFKEVKVEKVSDKIVNQLIDLITEGKLLPGEKLPSERRLTDLFGVGRSSLREALNTLETLGFIEIKKRKGNYVKNMDGAVALNPLKKIMQVDQKPMRYKHLKAMPYLDRAPFLNELIIEIKLIYFPWRSKK